MTVFDRLSRVGASMSLKRAFCAPSVGAFVKCKKPIFTILRRNSTRDATTSGRSWPSIKIPFLAVSTSKPISCSHFRAVSTETFHGNPGSRVELGSNVLLTHLQKSITVIFGVPFTTEFALTYSAALSQSFSFDHKLHYVGTVLAFLSGEVPLFLIRSACH